MGTCMRVSLARSLFLCVCVCGEREGEREMFWDCDVNSDKCPNLMLSIVNTNYYAKSGDDEFRGTK